MRHFHGPAFNVADFLEKTNSIKVGNLSAVQTERTLVATKEAVAKKSAVPAKKTVATKSAPAKAPAPKMTKTQIILDVAERMDVAPKQIAAFFDVLLDTATAQTRKTGEFTVPGFVKLVKAQRAARMGRNPATGESIKIAAKTTVKFRLSKTIKDAVVLPKK
jgi:DNA-binding protein HU-beta